MSVQQIFALIAAAAATALIAWMLWDSRKLFENPVIRQIKARRAMIHTIWSDGIQSTRWETDEEWADRLRTQK